MFPEDLAAGVLPDVDRGWGCVFYGLSWAGDEESDSDPARFITHSD